MWSWFLLSVDAFHSISRIEQLASLLLKVYSLRLPNYWVELSSRSQLQDSLYLLCIPFDVNNLSHKCLVFNNSVYMLNIMCYKDRQHFHFLFSSCFFCGLFEISFLRFIFGNTSILTVSLFSSSIFRTACSVS